MQHLAAKPKLSKQHARQNVLATQELVVKHLSAAKSPSAIATQELVVKYPSAARQSVVRLPSVTNTR